MKIARLLMAGLLAGVLFTTSALATEHTIGLGAALVPDYEGSDDYRGVPMLMLKGNYPSGRSFSLMGPNLRVNLVPSREYSLGPLLNYRAERDNVASDRVDAMREVDAAFEGGVFGGITLDNWQLGAELLADLSNEHDGMLAKFSVGYRWRAAADMTIIPRVSITYGDDDYMDTYFGVNRSNRGASGLPNYRADAGLKDVGFNLVVDYTPWERWGVSGIVSFSSLLNDARNSPLVDDEGSAEQMFFGLMGTYRWGSR